MPLLKFYGIEVQYDDSLIAAIRTRDLNRVKLQFPILTDWLVGPSNSGRYEALQIAFANGDNEIVSFLLEHGGANLLWDLNRLENILCGRFSEKPAHNPGKISQSIVIDIIKACFANPDFIKKTGYQCGFKYKEALSLFVGLLEKYNEQSEVIKMTFNLLEQYLIQDYQSEKQYALDRLSPHPQYLERINYNVHNFYTDVIDENEIKNRIRLKFLVDVYNYLIEESHRFGDKTLYCNVLLNLFKLFPKVDILNINRLDENNVERNIGIINQIYTHRAPIVEILMRFNTYSLESAEVAEIMDACLVGKIENDVNFLSIVAKHLKIKPNDPMVQALLKRHVAENDEASVIILLDFMGVASYFPEWKKIVEESALSPQTKQRFYEAEDTRNHCKVFANTAQTCKQSKQDLLSMSAHNYGRVLLTNNVNLRQLSMFALVHDTYSARSEALDQYQDTMRSFMSNN